MNLYFVYYAESNVVCLIIFAIMLLHDLGGVDRQEKQIKYDRALVSFMLYFLSDACWSAIIAGVLPRTRFSVLATNISNFVLMAALTYLWLQYVLAVEQAPRRNRPSIRFALVFPFLVSAVTLAATLLFAPHVIIDESLEMKSVFNVYLIAVPIVYIVTVLFYTLRKAREETNPVERRKHFYIGLFPLMVVLGGVAQIVLTPETPIFCFACTILMLIFYILSMDTLISVDALTGLNNRAQLARYVSQSGNLRREGRETFVMMLDINDFKMINDTYGHAEGDRALTIVAKALKKATERQAIPCFLGRFGGDEFILVVHPEGEEALAAIAEAIRGEVGAECERCDAPYTISVGIGYDALGAQDTFQKCMQRADEKLYLDKEACKREGRSTVRR